MSEKITTVIFDWAGTTIDYGCFAPVDAFIAAYSKYGIVPNMEETRAPMGLPKRDHIEKMLAGERISALWRQKYGRVYTQEDVRLLYEAFEPALFSTLNLHTDLIPGVLETVNTLKSMGIKIGSTTGYTRAMMDVLTPAVGRNGYAPDSLVCPDETGGIGRPFPYMLWRNLENLGETSIHRVLKVGDTAADMEEGKNAGCITVGVIKGSSMLGLSLKEYESKSEAELTALHEKTRKKYFEAGADYVIEEISELPKQILNLA